MAIDFPNSPTNGQEFTSGGTSWVYDGAKWNIKEATSYSNDSAPVGTILNFAGPAGSIPAGWIACDGSAVSRSTYATLFSVIGTTYGAGNGSTTFNLPDIDGTFGVFIIRWTTTLGVTATDSLYATPVGTMLTWPTTSSLPTGWLRADGSAVSRTTYADLFALIGTTYGTGNGSTTFNLPNMIETGGPVTIIKATLSGGQEPSTVAHAASHIRGGTDIIDGDRVQIDYVPATYARDSSDANAGADTDLTAHLKGIDNRVASTLATIPSRNRIVNGAMMVDQRRSGAASSAATFDYIADRFFFYSTGTANALLQRVQDGPAGVSAYSSKVTVNTTKTATGGDYFIAGQNIEGFNVSDLGFGTASPQPFVASFYVKSSVTGTFAVIFQNSGAARSYVTTYTINAANTWERKTIAVMADASGTWLTNNGVGLQILFGLGAGSTMQTTANVWASGQYLGTSGATNLFATASATWQVSGVQLEYGTTPTRFEHRSFDDELRRCQRYFCAQNVYATSGYDSGYSINTATAFFPVEMRAVPNVPAMTVTAIGHASGTANAVNVTRTSVQPQLSSGNAAYRTYSTRWEFTYAASAEL